MRMRDCFFKDQLQPSREGYISELVDDEYEDKERAKQLIVQENLAETNVTEGCFLDPIVTLNVIQAS